MFEINVGLLFTADNYVYQYLLWAGMVPRWTGTVAGMVDPQSFAEMALLHQIR